MGKISIKDYQSYIAPLIDAGEKKNCLEYFGIIQTNEKNTENNPEKNEILILFHKILSYRLVPDSSNEPFKPTLIMDGRRSPIPDDLTTEERDFLQQVLPKIKDAELKARVADTLWVLKHGKPQENAKTAIEAYLIASDTLLEERWLDTKDRLARALRIFYNIRLSNKTAPKNLNALKKISEYIENNATPTYLVVHLIDMLYIARQPYNAKHVKILESIATTNEANSNYNAARSAWDLASDLYNKEKIIAEAIRCQINAAETYVTQANIAQDMQNPSYMSISGFLQSAVEAYRSIHGAQQRRDEIYARLVDAQSRIQDEMIVSSVEFDFSDEIKFYVKKVSGLDVSTALYNFAFITEPPNLEYVKKQVVETEQNFPFLALATAQYHDHKGRVISKASIDSHMDVKMHRQIAQFHRNITAECALIPALQQIRLEHNISLFEWQSVIKNHPFIPPERVNTYALGLFHGFNGDFLSAAHILIPQIENSIRYLLNNHGKQTSRQRLDGTQEERNLNKTLKDKELKKLFSKDLIFDLQGLLIKKEGENLRNKIMHGLMDDNQLSFSPEMVYFYWLTLHIIFIPVRSALQANPDPQ